MAYLRSDIWCAAFVRRHNDLGHLCVQMRRGDPIAGQVFVEVDHLDGTRSLYTQSPLAADPEATGERRFQCRFARVEPEKVRERIAREIDFDPDLWVIGLDLREDETGLVLS